MFGYYPAKEHIKQDIYYPRGIHAPIHKLPMLRYKLCTLLQVHNPVQHNLVVRRIPVHGKVRNPHRLEPHALRSGLDAVFFAGLAVLCRPGSTLADVVEAHLDHGVGVDIFGVRVDVVEEVARWVSRGVIRLEQRVEQSCLCLDRTVVCRAVGDPLDETGLVSMLLQSKEGCTHALGFLGADPSAGLS